MTIQVSVRNLVEFILREGDIDNRMAKAQTDAMQEGGRIHRMIQKRMGIEYEAEVPLKFRVDYDNYVIQVEGRADGIIHRNNLVIVDEIKGTYRDLKYITEPAPVHLAQAMCYAYFVACMEELRQVDVRMTYCNIDTEEVKYFQNKYTMVQLREFFDGLMNEYRKWADFEYEWKKIRKESIRNLEFPFAYREGQKELAGHVYQTICHKKKLFIQAPTGVGKTISTVFPAVKAVGEEKADKIFYLTAKTITRTVAEEAFSLLRKKGLRYKTVTLTAKEKICPLEEMECNPEHCPYAKGHFGRVNDAIFDMLTHEECFDRTKIAEYALAHEVCPFEMSLDMSLFSDAVICDYNYLFDPYVYLKRYFTEGIKGPYLFLIDEAHNLVERGREMYSAQMVKEDVLALKKLVKPYHTGLEKYIERCNKELLSLKKQHDENDLPEQTGAFALALSRLHSAINTYLEEHEDCPVRKEILDFYFQAGRYLDVNERLDENYITYTKMQEDGSFCIRQFCVDPSERLRECMDRGIASVLFSATFLPIQYYKQLLGGTEEDFEVYARTAFSPEQLHLVIGKDVTSRYTRRNMVEYRNIASYIHSVVSQKNGNYMVFCPSHQFLTEVYDAYLTYFYDETKVECLVQTDYMDEAARERFLGRFKTEENALVPDLSGKVCMEIEVESKTILGFCVLGGIFSEGIDLKGEALIGAIIVGTGLPQVGRERELLMNYFDKQGKNGFDYAYRYPGMNKVLQAAGRVIRTVDDRGVVALLDDRFELPVYQKMFPREWEHLEVVTMEQCQSSVGRFWRKNDISSL
ncbi:MAG: ATP-dependent DNA helicase [Lachnospiraceae bacterium]|nr:ATP-dependent DNA helicase [Lachnospiraceae bacterium]